jgi:radical SAM superfamily enzyme YgiQ (UPF0313 family)
MSNRKVTLFYPLINEIPFYPPLGLLYISGPLLESGYQVRIIDANIEEDFKEKIIKEAKDSLCVGVSVILGNQVKSGYSVTTYLKRYFPNLPIIWGGWFPTLMYEQILEDKNIDFVVRGQGELTFIELVKALEDRRSFREIPSLAYKYKERIVSNEIRFINLKPINRDAYKLLPIEKYIQKNKTLGKRILGYVSSIGCYGRCGFCCLPMVFGRKRYFALKVEEVLDDLRFLIQSYNVNHIDILDFNFFVNRRRAKEILKGICRENLKFTWNANIRVDQILHLDEEFLNLLKESGNNLLYIGAESGSEKMLNLIQKDIKSEDIEKSNQILKKYNLKGSYSFITGIMKEDGYKDLEKSFQLVLRLKEIDESTVITFHHYSPWVGTPAFNLAVKMGFKPPSNLISWTNFLTENVVVPWENLSYEMKVVKFFQYYLPLLYPSPNLIKIMERLRIKPLHNLLKKIILLQIRYRFYILDPVWGLILIYKLTKKIFKKIRDFKEGV